MKGDRVWFELVKVARCAHESFPEGFSVIGRCSSSRNDVLSSEEGDRERRSTGEGRVNASRSGSSASSSAEANCGGGAIRGEATCGVPRSKDDEARGIMLAPEVILDRAGMDVFRTIDDPGRGEPYAEYEGGGPCRGNGNLALVGPETEDDAAE